MVENILQTFYEWPEWESIMHSLLFLLTMYILFMMYVNRKEITVTNMLLFAIIISIDILVHQNINNRNNRKPTYLL